MDAAEIPFGKFVRKVRRARDMTQEELAAFLGVSRDRIANIETGKTSGARGFRTLFFERMGIPRELWENKSPDATVPFPPTPLNLTADNILLGEITASYMEIGQPLSAAKMSNLATAKEEELLAESALLREALELRTKRELLAAAKASRQRWEAKAHGK